VLNNKESTPKHAETNVKTKGSPAAYAKMWNKIVFTLCNTHLIFPDLHLFILRIKKKAIPPFYNNNMRLLKAIVVARKQGGIQSHSFTDMKTTEW
jgi:hypothetical protein